MSDQPPATDALSLLHEQHAEVEQLFVELERLQPEAQGGGEPRIEERRRLCDTIIKKLMQHSAIEEERFYPAVAEVADDGDRLVSEALDQHREAERTAAALDGISPDNLDFDERMRALISEVREHVVLEESVIFPRIRAALPADRLRELGDELAAAMKHAPTRPHPHSPSPMTGVGKLMARGAAVADRMRDAAMGRKEV